MSDYLKKRQHDAMFGKQVQEKFSKIAKVGAKRKLENETYQERRIIFLLSRKVCEVNLKGCTKKSVEVHHKKGRIGKNFLDELYWLPSCRNCHIYLELNPEIAKELGFSENRLT